MLTLIFLNALVCFSFGDDADPQRALENPDLFEGDILGIEYPEDLNAVSDSRMVWPGGKVPYVIDSSLMGQFERISIQNTMIQYKTMTHGCIQFVPRTNEPNYIKLFAGQGCYSYVGLVHKGEQPVSLGRGCVHLGTITHELGHAIGFYHEQNRSDRDDHLIIYWENIKQGMENQFFKLKPEQNLLLSPFDYDSIMLYGEKSFSKDRVSKTMAAKHGNQRLKEVYEKVGLAKSDLLRIKKLYNC